METVFAIAMIDALIFATLIISKRRGWLRGGIVLAFGLSLIMLITGPTSPDGEAKPLATMLGSLGVCFLTPFFIVFRLYPSRLSPAVASLCTTPLLLGAVYANCYACRLAGTKYIHFTDDIGILVFVAGGWIFATFMRSAEAIFLEP